MNGLRFEWIDPKTLTPNVKNWRRHPEPQRAALADVLGEVGWAGAALYNERTGRLVDGHLRLDVALRRGDEAIPVLIGEWDEADEAKILATLDPIAAMATSDAAALDALLREVDTGSAAVMDMLRELAEGAGLYTEPVVGAGGDEFDTTPADGPTRALSGDLWQMGEHRLLVDDCTVAANVARLMGGEKADMVFTDPPYGVEYVGKTKDALTIQNDNLGDDGTYELVKAMLLECPLKDGSSFYVCSPPGNTETAFRLAIRDAGLELRQCLVWVKQHFVMGRQDYHWRHESILYGWRDGAAHYFAEDRTQDTVWEVDRPAASPDHPTQKPTELPLKAMRNSSKTGGIIFDGFGGSGTTLIAAERLNRRARLMEIEPRYADVILRRWEAETGGEAELLERGEPNGSTI